MSEFIGTKLTMNLGERSYDIIVKSGSLENLYQFARLDRRVAVVTDSGVPAQYAQMVADQCKDAHIITVPQGEASKSFKILESVLKQMLEFGMGRGDLVIAVGGGVVGDLAGFAASIYMRGIDFINCPTTTLSMIDSSIGHGIEAVKGIKGRRTVGLYHGECVALGMLPMIESKALQKRVRAVYRRLGLPTRTTYDKEKVLAEMLHDKKAQSGQITIIKVPGLGCWRAETIPVEGLRPLLGIEE